VSLKGAGSVSTVHASEESLNSLNAVTSPQPGGEAEQPLGVKLVLSLNKLSGNYTAGQATKTHSSRHHHRQHSEHHSSSRSHSGGHANKESTATGETSTGSQYVVRLKTDEEAREEGEIEDDGDDNDDDDKPQVTQPQHAEEKASEHGRKRRRSESRRHSGEKRRNVVGNGHEPKQHRLPAAYSDGVTLSRHNSHGKRHDHTQRHSGAHANAVDTHNSRHRRSPSSSAVQHFDRKLSTRETPPSLSSPDDRSSSPTHSFH